MTKNINIQCMKCMREAIRSEFAMKTLNDKVLITSVGVELST